MLIRRNEMFGLIKCLMVMQAVSFFVLAAILVLVIFIYIKEYYTKVDEEEEDKK